ncbi:phosphonate ABC transporter ATP-binding protein [Guptibacillus algicola]|uniref:phosphonate ABC transporter ATP-binding protein n=1 Tax=Guptibacillus algicola TaxID=225844 RepID=UPI001CD49B14|nr:phosphonate ABC transporter ATP-binding protein [Alkalihalobacillus algicola]MCA0988156.1 phosphonate ABC transporter ATP-binding protein [Alkalihalobacillus algicola]
MLCNDELLKITNGKVTYGRSDTPAIHDVNLTFTRGEFVCVLGKTGAGKSTLIRTLNGLQPLSEGTVSYQNQTYSLKEAEALRKIRRNMGMIFQQHQLIPRLSVLQNVYTGLFGFHSTFQNVLGLFTDVEKSKARQILEQVELLPLQHQRVDSLSGGQKQRVGIARALIQSPEVFLGDEPVASLDPGTADRIFQLIKKAHEEQGLLTIINVHSVKLALHYATRIIALKEGRVVFDDVPENLTEELQDSLYER